MKTKEQLKEWIKNRYLKGSELEERLPESVLQYAEYVGDWMWIEFPTTPNLETRETLKDLGFHFNSRRKVWQHPCGKLNNYSSKSDPREKYQTYRVPQKKEIDGINVDSLF